MSDTNKFAEIRKIEEKCVASEEPMMSSAPRTMKCLEEMELSCDEEEEEEEKPKIMKKKMQTKKRKMMRYDEEEEFV